MEKTDLNIDGLHEAAVYNNGDVAIVDNLEELDIQGIDFQTDFCAVMLCREGSGSVQMNGNSYVLRKNDLFVSLPNSVVKAEFSSADFKTACICMSIGYLQRLMPNSSRNWDFRLFFEEHPQVSLNEDEAATYLLYYDLFCSRLEHATGERLHKIIDSLMVAFMYEFQGVTERVVQAHARPYNSRESHFTAFIELLFTTSPKNRQVSYYADKLCITPKYLSVVCKEITGLSASKVIDQYVVKDIEYQLKHTSKSIKDISNEQGFPSVSFFGKYVRKNLGASPRAIRERFIGEETVL